MWAGTSTITTYRGQASQSPSGGRPPDGDWLSFGQDPDILAAQAYDAAGLILRVLRDGAATREQLREGLLTIRNYAGASGTTSMTETGEAVKELFLLMVRRGAITQIN